MDGRRTATAVSIGVLALAAAGCANALHDRTMTVLFSASATEAQLQAASKACAHVVPGISALPVPSDAAASRGSAGLGRAGTGGTIRFRIGGADDHDIARLTTCLNRQPGVFAVQPPNDDMS